MILKWGEGRLEQVRLVVAQLSARFVVPHVAVLFYVGPVQAFAGNQLGVEQADEWVSQRLYLRTKFPAARITVFDCQEER